jgi:Flp pilus assembly protein TadB
MSQNLVYASNLFAGLAAFTALSPLVNAILAPQTLSKDNWHRSQPRWNQLRTNSKAFRSLESWIVGVGYLIENRLPWFLELPKYNDWPGRAATTVFTVVFGSQSKLLKAVRIMSTVQPWSRGELLACTWLTSLTVAIGFVLVFGGVLGTWSCIGTAIAVFFVSHRTVLGLFIAKAEQRRRSIRVFLPHAMDTISMVMSSGDPFRAGLDTVIRDFPFHPLSQEFACLRICLDRGQTMSAALHEMAGRVCLVEFDELTRTLAQVHQHGVPASETFSRLAKQLRVVQLRVMEEQVGRSEAAMALPTMLILISCMLVAIAPFVLSIIDSELVN